MQRAFTQLAGRPALAVCIEIGVATSVLDAMHNQCVTRNALEPHVMSVDGVGRRVGEKDQEDDRE